MPCFYLHTIVYFNTMELATIVAEEEQMFKFESSPEQYHLELIGLQLGDVIFCRHSR